MKYKNPVRFFIIAIILFSFVFIPAVYYLLDQKIPGTDTNLTARQIETPWKLWLNGYLAIFTAFNYHSCINWFIIPLFIVFVYLKYRLKIAFGKSEVFLFVFILLSVILIGLKGFFNFRYSYTLVPLMVFLLFYLNYQICVISQNRKWIFVLPLFFLIISSINFFKQTTTSRFNYHLSRWLGIRMPYSVNKDVDNFKIDTTTAIRVANVLEYISQMKTDKFFLVNNVPDFYYYTNKKGHYYWCGDDDWLSEKGHVRIFDRIPDSMLVSYFLDTLNCHYIYTYKNYFNYHSGYDRFVSSKTRLVTFDKDNRLLFEIIHPK